MVRNYIVYCLETEITSYKDCLAAHVGMTLDDSLQYPINIHEFSNLKDARKFFKQTENDYFYNGSGYGYATEWVMKWEIRNDDWELVESDVEDFGTNKSNFREFVKRWLVD